MVLTIGIGTAAALPVLGTADLAFRVVDCTDSSLFFALRMDLGRLARALWRLDDLAVWHDYFSLVGRRRMMRTSRDSRMM